MSEKVLSGRIALCDRNAGLGEHVSCRRFRHAFGPDVHDGDVVTRESARRIREAARAIDEHFHVEFAKDTRGLVLTLLVR